MIGLDLGARCSIALRNVAVAGLLVAVSEDSLAQASPFHTGATSLLADFVAIATPVVIILVMVLGLVAATGRISWGWPIAALIGICVIFGAPQIVVWIRSVFAV